MQKADISAGSGENEINPEIPPQETAAKTLSKEERLVNLESAISSLPPSFSDSQVADFSARKNQEYHEEVAALERGIGKFLSNEARTALRRSVIDEPLEAIEKNNERSERLQIEKSVLENIDNADFRKRIAPFESGELTEAAFSRALEKIMSADLELSSVERLRLFKQTIESYSAPEYADDTVVHSTGSYSLRKSLEDGLSGGHGAISGEAAGSGKTGKWVQKGLSVSHLDEPSVESFQQMFARLCARKSELPGQLALDSERLTGKNLPEIFIDEYLNNPDLEGLKKSIAKRLYIPAENIDQAMLDKATGPEARRAFIDDFKRRQNAPRVRKMKREILPAIKDSVLRRDLTQEAKHSFPCMIFLDVSQKRDQLATEINGEKPTHISFEDFFYGKFEAKDIKEVRVPQKQIAKVEGWLKKYGIQDVKIVPFEIFEVKRVIQDSITSP